MQRRVATSPEDLPTPDVMLSMSGLEFLQSIVEGRLAGAPIGDTLGFGLTHAEDGKVVFDGAPVFAACNLTGKIHGGWHGAILDSAMTCAVMTTLRKGTILSTMEYKVSIIRPVAAGMKLTCTGWVEHAGRSAGVARGEIRDKATDKLIATGSTTCIIIQRG